MFAGLIEQIEHTCNAVLLHVLYKYTHASARESAADRDTTNRACKNDCEQPKITKLLLLNYVAVGEVNKMHAKCYVSMFTKMEIQR